MLTFLEQETDFFDDINAALRNDVLKIRSRQTDYLLSVLLNSIMTNYISTISSIDDALEDLEEELLTITDENEYRYPDPVTPASIYADEEIHSPPKGTIRKTVTGGKPAYP